MKWSVWPGVLMINGWREGSQGPAGVASSLPLMSRSTRCLAPNTPRTTTHQAPCRPSPLDLRVQDVHSTLPVRVHHSPPPPSAPNLSTPLWSRLHLYLMAAQLHSHAPPPRHLHPKKWPISGPTAPPKLLQPPTRTATGLGHTQLTREPFHLPLSRQHQHTEQELPQPTLPDTLTHRRSAFTASLRKSLHCNHGVTDRNVTHPYLFHNAWHVVSVFIGCHTKPGYSA